MIRAPWAVIMGPNYKGMVTVVGDAMHPMTPDLGQGGCAALEDAVVLVRNIGCGLSSKGNMFSDKKSGGGAEELYQGEEVAGCGPDCRLILVWVGATGWVWALGYSCQVH